MKIAYKSDNKFGNWRVTGIFIGRFFFGLMSSSDRNLYGIVTYPRETKK